MKKHFAMVLSLCFVGLGALAQPRSASQPYKLIENVSGLMAPVWSPSGDKIAVTTDNYTGILVANADGSNIQALTSAPGAGYKMAWSNDGKQIMGRVNHYENGRLMHEMKTWNVATGTEMIVKAKVHGMTETASWVKTNSVFDLMIANPGKAASQIAALKGYEQSIIINPALSPDGKKVAFQIPGKGVMLINADGTSLQSLCPGSHPAWLPDGKSLIVTRVKDNGEVFTSSDIYAVNIENGNEVLLTGSTDVIPLTPAVSPDGRKVAFENAADASIYVINLNY